MNNGLYVLGKINNHPNSACLEKLRKGRPPERQAQVKGVGLGPAARVPMPQDTPCLLNKQMCQEAVLRVCG